MPFSVDALLSPFLGEPATEETLAKIRAAAGENLSRIRVAPPKAMLSSEYLPGRLSLFVDEENLILHGRLG